MPWIRPRPFVLCLVMLLGAIAPAPARAEGAPLDVAAMPLTPPDLVSVGLDDFGIGQTMYTDEMANELVASHGMTPEAARSLIDDTGFVRWYLLSLLGPDASGDPSAPAGRMVITAIMEFRDARGAADAWAVLEDESSDPLARDIALSRPFGIQAEATRTSGTDVDGTPYAQLDLTVLDDNLHVGVVLIDWIGGEPRLGDAETLTDTLLDRVRDIRVSGAPGLGNQALRLAGEDVQSHADYYTILDGTPVGQYRVPPIQAAARAVYYSGATDVYHLFQQLAARGEGPDNDSWYLLQVVRFEDAATASRWFAGREEYIGTHPDFTDFEVDVEAPPVGDESFSYTLVSVDGTSHYRGVVLRVGTTVAVLDVYGMERPPRDAVMMLAQKQTVCLTASCIQPVPVPSGLTGTGTDDRSAATPAAVGIDPDRRA